MPPSKRARSKPAAEPRGRGNGRGSEAEAAIALRAFEASEAREEQIARRLERKRIDREVDRRLRAEELALRGRAGLPAVGYTLKDRLAEPDEPLERTIDGLHFKGGNSLLVAQYKTGKTVLEINLARSLADGVPFLGKFDVTFPKGRVAIFNYEMNPRQFLSWMRDVGIANPDRIVVLDLRGEPPLAFWEEGEMDRVADWLLRNDVKFLIADPASAAWLGLVESESDNVQISYFTRALDELKRHGGVGDLLLTTHTPRAKQAEGQERARGGGQLEGWPDASWYLTKNGEVRSLNALGRDVTSATPSP